jgi:hypothetical protein
MSQKKETPGYLEFLNDCPFPLVPIPQFEPLDRAPIPVQIAKK